MPKPAGGGQRYVPGLDGLRAVAVLAVVAYHVGLGWAQGGLLGVGIFFTLSGYLITDLLLGQYASAGRLRLVEFWRRRARRLLPALFVMLAVVAGWVALLQSSQLPALRGATAAAATYVSNWWLIAQHSSYFAQFGPPSPLGHLWSLAVEEQFYLLWPWLLVLGLRCTRGRPERTRRYVLAAATLVLAAASVAGMVALYHPGYDPTRVYDGTDTRAFALLIGAALAFVCPSREMAEAISERRRWLMDGTGLAGLIVIGLLIWRTTQYSPFLYRGGMVVLSVATAAVVWSVASPAGRLGRVLGSQPLRWLGVRSYGIYLWHYPIIVLTTPANATPTLARGAAQVAASILVAALSWRFIEEPIRHGAVGRWTAQLRAGGWHSAARRGWAILAGAVGALGLAGVALAGVVPAASAGPASQLAAASGQPSLTGQLAGTPVLGRGPVGGQAQVPAGTTPLGQRPASAGSAGPRTSCRSVVHIGDSTSDGLISPDYLPDPRQRITSQYAMVGVTRSIMEISGGRSIVETLPGQANAYTVAQGLVRAGYRGCWVLALGTNDTADVYVGSNVGLATRIRQMMSVIGDEPVMWVNVKSLLSSGPYSEHNMQLWNSALLQACPRYPNMKVFNWAAFARPQWFISDGIHYTSAGYAARSNLIATALAYAFPQFSETRPLERPPVGEPSGPGCLVD
jgi:peptidoglycan/LPS O-acetylase OafA/YrhL/lysophospholipase L1-like esterase